MSMSEAHRRTIEKSAPYLLSDLDSDDVVPYLLADDSLTRDDVDKIKSRATRKEKVETLLDIIPRRGAGAYVSLLNSLTKTEGSKHLYDVMKTNEDEVSSRAERPPVGVEKPSPSRQFCHPTDEPSLPQDLMDSRAPDNDVDMADLELANCQDLPKPLIGLGEKQPSNPNRRLKDPDLLELAQELGEHWEILAHYLGLNKALVFQCKENNKNSVSSQIFDMLYKWKCKNGKDATVLRLVRACEKIKLLDQDAYDFLYSL